MDTKEYFGNNYLRETQNKIKNLFNERMKKEYEEVKSFLNSISYIINNLEPAFKHLSDREYKLYFSKLEIEKLFASITDERIKNEMSLSLEFGRRFRRHRSMIKDEINSKWLQIGNQSPVAYRHLFTLNDIDDVFYNEDKQCLLIDFSR